MEKNKKKICWEEYKPHSRQSDLFYQFMESLDDMKHGRVKEIK